MKNNQYLLVASLSLNILLLFCFIILNATNEQERHRDNKDVEILREIIENHFFMKFQLNNAIASENTDGIGDAIAIAQDTMYRNLMLHEEIDLPKSLKILHNTLHGYLFQYQKVIRDNEHESKLLELKALADMLDHFEEELDYSYYDDYKVMEQKLITTSENVIKPFLSSDQNPL